MMYLNVHQKCVFVCMWDASTVAKRAQCAANRKKNHLQIKKTTSSIWQHARCKCSQHKQIKKHTANKILFGCVVSICSTCCQIDEDVFLICWCFFYLHVFSEVAARWALSATVCKKIIVKEVLTWAHFDTGLVALRSPAVVSVLPDLHRKKTTTNKDKHKIH